MSAQLPALIAGFALVAGLVAREVIRHSGGGPRHALRRPDLRRSLLRDLIAPRRRR